MLLRLSLYDKGNQYHGDVRLDLDWSKNEWAFDQGDTDLWRRVGFTLAGPFEAKSWGVIWIFDQSKQHNTIILHDAPISDTVSRSTSGSGRIFDPQQERFKNGGIEWAMVIKLHGLNPLRREAQKKLTQLLPAPYGGDKWQANPYRALKPGPIPNYTNCVDFPAYFIQQLTGKKLIAPGYPPPTTPGWKNADEKDPKQIPLPGDIFILCETAKRDGTTAHVGVVYDTSWDNSGGAKWRTGDWGQGNDSFNGDFVVRTYDKKLKTLTNAPWDTRPPRAILGWVDLDELFAKAKPKK